MYLFAAGRGNCVKAVQQKRPAVAGRKFVDFTPECGN